jgi:hypothetical protein
MFDLRAFAKKAVNRIVATRAGMWAVLMLARFVRWIKEEHPPRPPAPSSRDTPVVYKALAINVTRDDVVDLPLGGIRTAADPLHHYRENDVPSTWDLDDKVNVELRYMLGQRKFRIVLMHDMTPEAVAKAMSRMKVSPDSVAFADVVDAYFIDTDGSPGESVTARAAKYLGPNKDCHGVRVRVSDMFPRDDHSHNAPYVVEVVYQNGERKCLAYTSHEPLTMSALRLARLLGWIR